MDPCNQSSAMMPLAIAIEKLLTTIQPIKDEVAVALDQSLDRILARDITSPICVPGHDNSAMDGFAVKSSDLKSGKKLTLIGKAFAGTPYNGVVHSGECVRIMTGAVMPAGSDSVIMQEKTNLDETTVVGDTIEFYQSPAVGNNVRTKGEDITTGEIILRKGKRLSPIDIGLMASVGIDTAPVLRKVTVSIFSTGDELQLPGQPLAEGQIYESNRFVVLAMLQRLGVDTLDLGTIKDNPEALREAFLKASHHSDAVISTGGVSVGEADYTKEVLEELGDIDFWKVAIKPGKPFAFGKINTSNNYPCYFFGLPGNPVSAAVTFHQLSIPAIQRLAGESIHEPHRLNAITESNLKKTPGRTDFQRGVMSKQEDLKLTVKSTGNQGSGVLSSMSQANCYVVLNQDHGDYRDGEKVTIQPFDRWIM